MLRMQRVDGRFVYSASDLNHYLECKRLTELEALVARGKLERPRPEDAQGDLIRRKGEEHEARHLAGLRERYPGEIEEFGRSDPSIEAYRQAERRTLQAMRDGKRVIYQATFFDGEFIGHADFLWRVDGKPSTLGGYGYEVVDTKLALSPKAYYLVQICNYSEHLARLQGSMPEFGHVVFGDGREQRFRLNDYMAYYRHLKRSFLRFAGDDRLDERDTAREYPVKVTHCEHCAWNEDCTLKRREDDHLSLVAWMRRDQIAKFEAAGITRVTQLAAASDELRPEGMSPETFVKLRRQASLQVRGRSQRQPIYELLAHDAPVGFFMLPAPSEGDVFFDMEGDPLYEPGRRLEYLFGCWMPGDDPQYRRFWAKTPEEEKVAFESFVDFVTERRGRYPELHVYHFAPYEKIALRRLAQEHCTRERQIDALLRDEVLVDLYAVVRQAMAISEESYGLKKIEKFYDLARATEVKKGDQSIVMFENWRTTNDQSILDDIEAYNRDDCRSTHGLLTWLLARRLESAAKFGLEYVFRVKRAVEPKAENEAEEDARGRLERELLANVLLPQNQTEYAEMSEDRRTRFLLAGLLGYHKREERPQWWAFFDRCENLDNLLEFDREPIAGLRLCTDIPSEEFKKSRIYTYRFPEQHHKMSPGEAADPRTKKRVTIAGIDDEQNLIKIKTTLAPDMAAEIREVIPNGPPHTGEHRGALMRIARSFLNGNLARENSATLDLVANRNPRLRGPDRVQPERVDAPSISAAVSALDGSYLFIQGPPGSGKSTYASHVIADLLERGKRVAVTSTGHAAIHNLLHKIEERVAERGRTFAGRYKHSDKPGSEFRSKLGSPMIESDGDNKSFGGEEYDLAGGTSWLFVREELAGKFDYLFIDEAGQVALADALALSLCARNVVLLGDPSQLAQVTQGHQPLHAGDSVLQHLLGERQTVAEDRGIFLDRSYRMQPEICDFISDAMYDGRLEPAENARAHRISLGDRELAGLYRVAVDHAGNSSSSPQEADEIVRIVSEIHPYEPDIIVVTPYNAQRRLIADRLSTAGFAAVRAGTVDKFQGQEAAVVLYSMATSSGEDVPRSMEFLFERNRFNVAISRAKSASVLVYSPRLLDISCRSPEEMELANLLCAFVERAKALQISKETVVP